MAINTITVSGNIGRDCEVRHSQSGTAFANFSLPVKSGWGDNEKTTWVTVKIIGKRAEGKLPEMLTKGQKVVVTGRLETSDWEDKNGGKRTTVEIYAMDIELAGGKPQQQEQAPSGPDNDMGDDVPF